jgi:hypothetical protein
MKKTVASVIAVLLGTHPAFAADEVSSFKSYVDSDICARLMLGPVNSARISCSQKTYKNGAEPVLVRLSNNVVLEVNKTKMIKKLVGQLAQVSGDLKVKDGTVKLKEVTPIEAASIPQGDPARKLLDVRTYKAVNAPKMYERIRHELAMMPYISEYDFISFTLLADEVILTGWTVRQTNRSEAENRIKNIEGVTKIVNNIDVLPLGSMDMGIRAGTRAALAQNLSRYFWGSGSDIKIIVKNGDIILLGTVATEGDKDLANIKANGVTDAFHVFNLLEVKKS